MSTIGVTISNTGIKDFSVKKLVWPNLQDELFATGTVELLTGGSGSVDGITVNSVEVMSGAESFDTDLGTTAAAVAVNITAHTSSPDYNAAAVGSVITITAVTGGSGTNGFAVVSSATTITTTDTNMAGGDEADVGEAMRFPEWFDRTIQVTGTFGSGGSARWEGSNDGGNNYIVLTDPQGVALNVTTASIVQITEMTEFARPRITAGDETTDLTIAILARRQNFMRT